MQSRRTFALWLFLFCLISPLAVTQVYTVTDLGPLAPTAINNWGQVAGNRNGHAFIWTKWGSLDLGTLAGGTFSRAAAINDLGAVAGTADGPGTLKEPSGPNQECSDLTQPFVWTPRNGMQGLGAVDLGKGFDWCVIPFYATGINAFGEVVGYNNESGTTFQYGFVWTKAAGMAVFGGSWPPTYTNGVSNKGEIVGQNSIWFDSPGHAATWKNGVMTDLGTFAGADPEYRYGSSANGVNDVGQVVGGATLGYSYIFWSEPFHAVLWTGPGGIRDLGTLTGDSLSIAHKINLFGQVIGSSGNSMALQLNGETGGSIQVIGRPFIWTERNGMLDLNTLIPANLGWVLNSAADINIWGQIVGLGTRNGKPHGFLLTPKRLFRF